MILEVKDNNIESILKNENKLIILDFWAEWCNPCKILTKVIEEIAASIENDVIIGKVNVDEEPELIKKYGIRNIPTLIFIKDNQVIDKQVGAISKNDLLEKIKKHI
ncbi:MAG: thioredoxin [Bacteroidales bacterium]|nr:thioredoxin [Bacteroidales bacterium]